MDMETVSHISLGTLLSIVIVYFILENSVLDNYIRFLLTPYLGNGQIGFGMVESGKFHSFKF